MASPKISASDKVKKARAGLILQQPFFGSLALRLVVAEDKTIDTACTDGISMLYNPKFIDSLTLDETKGVIAHEVMHCACAHFARLQGRELKKWNVAGDYAINPLVLDAGMALPKGCLTNHAWKNMSAEAIYPLIPEQDSNGDGNDPGGCGGVKPQAGTSKSDQSKLTEEWKISAAQAAQYAKSCGKLPDSLNRFMTDLLNPQIDWCEYLRRFLSQHAKNDYRWFPPNRRFIYKGLYLPSCRSEELGEICVAIDTSGSISKKELARFATELNEVLETYQGASATVIYCDAAVAHTETFTYADLPLKLSAKGGGGTDFKPPFKWIEENSLNPVCMIYFTDLECSSFPSQPGYPVLWVIVGGSSSGGNREVPPFGEAIYVTPE
jgi:predicted metal-dependent peptidase